MKSRLDNMSVKTFYFQAKYEKAAEIFDECFGPSTGTIFRFLKIVKPCYRQHLVNYS